MTNSRVIPATPAAVWAALNDPAALQASIPGCESLERVGDDEWRAVLTARVGPVSAKFTGTMRMTDATPPTGYTLQFAGQGGAAGFANGEAKVALSPAEGGQTLLTYVAKAQIGGKLAQIGSRLIDGAAAKMADDFFERFSAHLAPETRPGGEAMIPVSAGTAPAGTRWVRYVALAAIAAIIVYLSIRFR
ncbi:MAG: carbon monoxide dehydrogenase subunit G [Casimicrobiaceae bacterium]